MKLFGLLDGVLKKVTPEARSIGFPEGKVYTAVPTPLIGRGIDHNGLFELDVLSFEEFDVCFRFVAVGLDTDAVLFNDHFSFKALTAIRGVHLLVQANHYQNILSALCPIDYWLNDREFPASLPFLNLEDQVLLLTLDVTGHIFQDNFCIDRGLGVILRDKILTGEEEVLLQQNLQAFRAEFELLTVSCLDLGQSIGI